MTQNFLEGPYERQPRLASWVVPGRRHSLPVLRLLQEFLKPLVQGPKGELGQGGFLFCCLRT